MVTAKTFHDTDAREVASASEIQRLLAEDTTPWYKKKNLRSLYFFLVPAALGVEMTSGTYVMGTRQARCTDEITRL
jgi:hypothetical protein